MNSPYNYPYSIQTNQKSLLSAVPAHYALFLDEELLYIGVTQNLKVRFMGHHLELKYGMKKLFDMLTLKYEPILDCCEAKDRYRWMEQNKKREKELIAKYDPLLNFPHRHYKKEKVKLLLKSFTNQKGTKMKPRCNRCKKILKPGQIVWLELSNTDYNYYSPDHIPSGHVSQGCFEFGKDCATIELKNTLNKLQAEETIKS